MRIAICDDSLEQVKLMNAALLQYTQLRHYDNFELFGSDNPLLFLETLEKNGGYDIVLLDVYMPGISGLDVAKEIRARGDRTEIIFLSSSVDFAVEAFALNAVHYIVKPFTPTILFGAMDRAMARFTQNSPKLIPLILKSGSALRMDIDEIVFVESFGHEKIMHLKNGTLASLRLSLTELLDQLQALSPDQFILPCKGYIVNQKFIRTVHSAGISLYSGEVIPIATRSFRKVRERFFDYIFRDVATH